MDFHEHLRAALDEPHTAAGVNRIEVKVGRVTTEVVRMATTMQALRSAMDNVADLILADLGTEGAIGAGLLTQAQATSAAKTARSLQDLRSQFSAEEVTDRALALSHDADAAVLTLVNAYDADDADYLAADLAKMWAELHFTVGALAGFLSSNPLMKE